ncbi:Gustatory receptor 8a [Lucilia cuprina]|nr:Gustatory receptor 8a [Lucilia cuprina]
MTNKFFRIYSTLHQQWTDGRQTKKELKIYKRFFLLLLFYWIVVFVVEINYIVEIHHKKQWIRFFIAYMPSVTICRIRLLQSTMYLYMIMIEILQLNKEILKLVPTTKSLKLNFLEEVIYNELSVFMRKYQEIYTMMELFKKSCSISLLVIFIKSYVKIISDSYWTYWVIYNKDDVYVSTYGLSHIIILIEIILTHESSTEFFRVYSALHQQWTDGRQTKMEFKIYNRFFRLFLLYCIVLFAININYMLEIGEKKEEWLSFFSTYTPSVMICSFRLMQITMNLYIIMTEILQLNKEILELVVTTKSIKLNFLEEMIYNELSIFMRKYQDIYTMMELFKKSCSISLLVLLIKSYVKILSDSYWTYWVIYNKEEVYEFAEYSLIIPTAFNVFLTLIISKECMNAAKLIPHSLHSLRHRVENLKLSYKIQNFSLQLRHQQIVIDAFGCFTVDCYIVSGVSCVVACKIHFH